MMRKLLALALILTLLLPLLAAPVMAGEPSFGHQLFTYKSDNFDLVKFVRCDHPDNRGGEYSIFDRHYALRQTSAPAVLALPDGTITYPLTIGMKETRYEIDGTSSRSAIPALVPEYKGADFSVANDILYMSINLNVDSEITVSLKEPLGWSEAYYFAYDRNGYQSANDLSLSLPETTGITADPASTPIHLILNLAKGTPLPAMTAFKAAIGDQKTRTASARGFFTPGKAKTYLPVTDPQLLVQYPTLLNACLLTFMVFDKRNKTTHYALVEARWME